MTRSVRKLLWVVALVALAAPGALASHDPHTRESWCGVRVVGCSVGEAFDGPVSARVGGAVYPDSASVVCYFDPVGAACGLADSTDRGVGDLTQSVHWMPGDYFMMLGFLAATADAQAENVLVAACATAGGCGGVLP